jgi:SAM-dependent methyltransferase
VINTIDSYTGLDFPPTVNMGYNGKPDVFGDAQSLPFADESFDTVLLLDVLEHLPEPERALLEARRVLKTNGNIITQVPFLYPLHDEPFDFHRWTLHALNALFLKHGIQVREITHHGNPVETATALLVIALTKGVIDSIHQRHFGLLLVPLLILSIPIINVVGWLLGRLLPNSELMPLGYRILGTKL